MQDFTSGLHPIHFTHWRGTVVDQPVSVSTTVIVSQDFFVRPGDGGPDKAVQLRNSDVPLADGQNVTVVTGFPDASNNGRWALLVNHTASEVRALESPGSLVTRWKLIRRWWLYGLIVWIVSWPIGIHGSSAVAFLAFLGLSAYGWSEHKAMSRALQTHLAEIGEQILALR